jgi:hypothetical protein
LWSHFLYGRKFFIHQRKIGNPRYMHNIQQLFTLAVIAVLATISGCVGRPYVYEPANLTGLRDRAETRTDGDVRVSAAVPGRDETKAVFGIDLYAQGIQPIWLEIENRASTQVRYALVSTDSNYFSPFEVAYKNRGGFSNEGRLTMEKRFVELGMPRYIDADETRSGFVFTHAESGTKGFNVDVFGATDLSSFSFLLPVPGFEPDYANVDAASIYSADELTTYNKDQIAAALRDMPCCSTSESGEPSGEPLNIILVGNGPELLQALLRSGWTETSVKESAELEAQFLFGRPQEAIFRHESLESDSVYEMRFWLAPIMYEQERVWVGQARHFYLWGGALRRFDPDVDNARNFAMQKLLYGQALRAIGWLAGDAVIPTESFWDLFLPGPYFTDGYRIVLWLSPEPLAVNQIDIKNWDVPPRWKNE